MCNISHWLFSPGGRSLAGAEDGSRVSHGYLDPRCDRMRATEHAPRDPFRGLERRYCLAEIVECGVGVPAECHRVIRPQRERESMISSENTVCHGYCFAQQRLCFSVPLQMKKGRCVVVGYLDGGAL